MLLVNIYAPNSSKSTFFEELQNQLDKVTFDHLIITGDFNGTVNNKTDRLDSKKRDGNKKGKLPSFF